MVTRHAQLIVVFTKLRYKQNKSSFTRHMQRTTKTAQLYSSPVCAIEPPRAELILDFCKIRFKKNSITCPSRATSPIQRSINIHNLENGHVLEKSLINSADIIQFLKFSPQLPNYKPTFETVLVTTKNHQKFRHLSRAIKIRQICIRTPEIAIGTKLSTSTRFESLPN